MTTRPESFVTFPGDAGVFHERADTNLLDADTAHLFQALGHWGPIGSLTEAELADASVFGGKVWRAERTGGVGTVEWRAGSGAADNIPVIASTQYWFAIKFRKSENLDAQFLARTYDSGGGLLDSALPYTDTDAPQADMKTVSGTFTTPATAVRLRFDIRQLSAPDGAQLDIAEFCLRQSEGLFVPSLRIVGDLDMRVDVAPVDWTPPGNDGLMNRYHTTTNDRAWRWALDSLGRLTLTWSRDGGASDTGTLTTAALGLVGGERHSLRSVLRVADGEWDTYVDDAVFETVPGLDAHYIAASPFVVGASWYPAGGEPLNGVVYSAELRDGIDGPVVASWVPDEILGGSSL